MACRRVEVTLCAGVSACSNTSNVSAMCAGGGALEIISRIGQIAAIHIMVRAACVLAR